MPGDAFHPKFAIVGGMMTAAADISAGEWRQIVDSAVDTAIISTDRQGRVTSWSEGASLSCRLTVTNREAG